MKISGIYKIINKTNNHYYVGSSTDILKKRWSQHKKDLQNGKHYNKHLQKAWDKYGEKNFDWIVVEKVNPKNLLIIEQTYLNTAKSEKEKCYNQSFVAGRIEMTDDLKKRLSQSHTGKIHTEETKQKISKHNAKTMLGKHHPREIKERISKKMRGIKNPFFGKHHTDEVKKKLSNSRMGKIQAHVLDPTIYQFLNKDTQQKFVGTKNDFIKKYNLIKQHVYDVANQKRNRTGNWVLYHQ